MKLSIVIVSWNTRALLRDCLSSIFQRPPQFTFEVIIVDNASSDGSAGMIRDEFPSAHLLQNQANLGFAMASNQGAGMASGRYLLFLNSDTRIQETTLNCAVAYMEKHPGTGIMGCRTLNPDGSPQVTAREFPGSARIFASVSGLNRWCKLSRLPNPSRRGVFDYVQGSFLIIAKSIFEHCGGFDERFFLYGEDVDLCLRVRSAGLAIGYDPETAIIHQGGGSSKNQAPCLAYFISSCILLYKKHRKTPQVKRLAKFIKSALLLRLLAEHAFSILNFRTRRKETASCFDLLRPSNLS